MSDPVYLDWNATAPLAPAAAEAMADAMAEAARAGRNPSSQHGFGRAARARLEAARRSVAARAGAEPSEIVFTSGATEAAALLMRQGWDAVLYSSLEHDCVRAGAEASGVGRVVGATRDGVIDLAALEAALAQTSGARRLVVLMAANNETGALQPIAEAAGLVRASGAAFAVDAAQALGKIPFDFSELGADFALFSAHKLGGPTGVGALVVRSGFDLKADAVGGGQEMRRRAGTENWLGAVGFGAAAAAADLDAWAATARLRDSLEAQLKNKPQDLVFFAEAVNRLPNTLCVAASEWRAETQLMRLDLAGFAVSAGSACSSGKMAASHVIEAMGFGPELAECAIRISFGPSTRADDLAAFAETYSRLLASRRS